MVHAALDGKWDTARELHLKYHRVFNDLFIDTNPIPVKAAMAMLGMIKEVYRLPLCGMDITLRRQLEETLRRAGVLEA